MELYAEQVLLENFLVDYALLYCTAAFSVPRARKRRMMLSAALGAVYALLMPVVPPLSGLAGKLLLSAAMIILAFWRRGRARELPRTAAVFCLCGAAAAGICVAMAALLQADVLAAGGGLFASGTHAPLVFSAAGAALFGAGLAKRGAVRYLRRAQNGAEFVVTTERGSVRIQAATDTGNSLRSGDLPVAVVSRSAILPVLEEDFLRLLGGEMPHSAVSFRVVPFRTVGEQGGVLFGFVPKEARVERNGHSERVKCVVAVSADPGEFSRHCRALLPVFSCREKEG